MVCLSISSDSPQTSSSRPRLLQDPPRCCCCRRCRRRIVRCRRRDALLRITVHGGGPGVWIRSGVSSSVLGVRWCGDACAGGRGARFGFTAEADEDGGVVCGEGVQGVEFGGGEELGQDEPAQRDQRDDQDGEADTRDGLGDGDRAGDGEELDGYEEEDAAVGDAAEWFGRLDESFFGEEVDDLLHDGVAFDGAPADDEEDPGEDGAWHGVQDHEEGAGHGADDGERHEEVGESLFDDGDGDGVLAPNFLAVGC